MDHQLSEPIQIRHPGGKDGMWRVTCSCGYRTTYYALPSKAESAAKSHKWAKENPRGS